MNPAPASTDGTLFTARCLTIAVPDLREFPAKLERVVPALPAAEVDVLLRRRAPA